MSPDFLWSEAKHEEENTNKGSEERERAATLQYL